MSTPFEHDDIVVRLLDEVDVPAAARVFGVAMGRSGTSDERIERYRRYWDLRWSLGAFDGAERLLGVAAALDGELTVEGGAALPCLLVPSVGVRPDSHGRGVGRALLEQQVRDAAGRGADGVGPAAIALNSSEVAIYERYGYGPTSRWWSTEAHTRGLRWRDDAPSAAPGSITEVDDLDVAVTMLRQLHRASFGRWSGEVSRPDGLWWGALHPTGTPPITAVHRDAEGQVDAAVRFTVETAFDPSGFANVVEVHDSIAIDPGSETLLWRWLLERRLVGTVRAERTNPRLPIHWMLVDPRQFRTTVDSDAVWVRILDVPRVLAARTSRASGSTRIRVLDPLVDRNDRVFDVVGDGDRLHVDAARSEPEIVLPVDLLASVVWGHVRVATLVAAGRVAPAAPDAVARLDALLATDCAAWSSTGF